MLKSKQILLDDFSPGLQVTFRLEDIIDSVAKRGFENVALEIGTKVISSLECQNGSVSVDIDTYLTHLIQHVHDELMR